MIKIKILSIGKTKESWLEQAIAEYTKRLQSTIAFQFIWAKNDVQLQLLANKENLLIALDPNGKHFTSPEFAQFFFEQTIEGASQMAFLIGGPEGLPAAIKQKAPLISLSKMTFTHQMTRLLIVEQIYRATEILKGSAYHKF